MVIDEKLKKRFWAKVQKGRGCWLWRACRYPGGYGKFAVASKPELAHRVAWEIAYGPIPKGLCCLHSCDVPACVNPEHLWLGSNAQNMGDAAKKGRMVRKLSADMVRKIRQRAQSGETHAAIARDYPVTRRAVGHAVAHRTWRHINRQRRA